MLCKLDLLEDIVVDYDKDRLNNQINALHSIRVGLKFLYLKMIENESEYRKMWEMIGCPVPEYHIGNGKGPKVNSMISNYYYWFSTSLINYLRLVGFIFCIKKHGFEKEDLKNSSSKRKIKESIDEYIKSIDEIGDVLTWRNKVSAHFAITSPRSSDSLGDLEISTIFGDCYFKGRHRPSDFNISFKDKDGESHSSNLNSWSLTMVYESLNPRFLLDKPLLTEMGYISPGV